MSYRNVLSSSVPRPPFAGNNNTNVRTPEQRRSEGVRGITREDLSSKVIVRNGAPPLASRKPATSSAPVCVHCRNLGLTFDHWLRKSPEPDSPVVCPVLLKTECRYCHELGHTVGLCPAKKRSTERKQSSYVPLVPLVPLVSTVPLVPLVPTVPTVPLVPTVLTYRQLPLDADGLHDNEYSLSYGDAEVDRQVAERRALFTSGKSWADICYDADETDKL